MWEQLYQCELYVPERAGGVLVMRRRFVGKADNFEGGIRRHLQRLVRTALALGSILGERSAT